MQMELKVSTTVPSMIDTVIYFLALTLLVVTVDVTALGLLFGWFS